MKKKLTTLLLFTCMVFCTGTFTVKAAQEKGWKTENNHKVYYIDGNKYTKGWLTIGNYRYYFESPTGYLSVNKIAGDDKKGYYYVGEDGIQCKDATIKKAVSVVMKTSKVEDAQKKRFKKAFEYITDARYRHMSGAIPKKSQLSEMANYMFNNKRGNCYRYSAALTYIAKVLGYETRMVPGYIERKSNVHGWCEVKSGNKYLICDGSFAAHAKHESNFAYRNGNFFMVPKEKHPRLTQRHLSSKNLGVNKIYKLIVRKGKVIWKTVK